MVVLVRICPEQESLPQLDTRKKKFYKHKAYNLFKTLKKTKEVENKKVYKLR